MMTNDVVILGGGLSGATLAIQLKQRLAGLRVTLIERQPFPVAEAAHKVGESSVEVGAHYYNEILNLSHALIPSKIPKLGLRYFFPWGDNARVELRPELGQTHYHSVLSTQFDRGRQENILREQCVAHGVCVIDGRVNDVILSREHGHRVQYECDGQRHELVGRWVVDATGRRSLIKRKLGLTQSNDHEVNASWWRVAEPLAVDDLSIDPAWQRQVPFSMRRLSTNHFMGRGYWVWLIPLASGSISMGIVADPARHPFEEINTFERAREWLRRYEPQIDALMDPHVGELQDFRTQKRFSYGAKQVFSGDRWALTGEAGVFLDPFYSPGSDFIAFSNGFITELIQADLLGADIEAIARSYNRQYLSLYQSFLLLYQGQYEVFGNAQVMPLKVAFDYTAYWGSTALVYFQNKLYDLDFLKTVTVELVQVHRLARSAQRFLRQWSDLAPGPWAGPAMLNYHELDYLAEWQALLRRPYPAERLPHVLHENRRVMELVAGWLYQRATGTEENVDPYQLNLRAEDIRNPPRKLDMFTVLNEYVNRRTMKRDGLRQISDPPH